jgi:trimeric autotransporter adhesin
VKTFKQIYPMLLALLSLAALTGCAVARNAPATTPATIQENKSPNVIAGFQGNQAAEGVQGATINGGGGLAFPNQVSRDFGTIGGGEGNLAGERAVVGGGMYNTASGFRSTVGGGSNNLASSNYATVGGGTNNTASAYRATVAGGADNTASEMDATVGGGSGNVASFRHATVAGGTGNTANNVESTVGGGSYNTTSGAYATTGGGTSNTAAGFSATVSGGAGNLVNGSYATVSGGLSNKAEGKSSTVPGGYGNQALADYSFAAGSRVNIDPAHTGAMLFADASHFPFASLAPNEFAVRASGGVRFVTSVDQTGEPLTGVRLPAGSGSWETLSDRNAKAGFKPIDGIQVLERLAAIPIDTWNYKGQPASVQHIGPVAQDFYAAFGLGEDNRYISSVDADGVAMAAIQGLYQMTQEKQALIETLQADHSRQAAQIEALQAQNNRQADQLASLDARLTALENKVGGDNASPNPSWLLLLGLGFGGGLFWDRRKSQEG